jgi:hypothetical protein
MRYARAMLRRLDAFFALAVTLIGLAHPAHAQPAYSPYGPVGYPPPPPVGEAPMGMERRQRFTGHPYLILEYMPLNDWRYETAYGGDADLGMGGGLMVGYMSYFGLGLELRAGARHHASRYFDGNGATYNYGETVVPILGGLRYDMASIWGGGFVEPFLATHAGGGGYFLNQDGAPSYSEWDFMFDMGLGVDFYVTRWVAFGLSYWFEFYANNSDLTMHSLAIQLTL